jgi:hypothetical protein
MKPPDEPGISPCAAAALPPLDADTTPFAPVPPELAAPVPVAISPPAANVNPSESAPHPTTSAPTRLVIAMCR